MVIPRIHYYLFTFAFVRWVFLHMFASFTLHKHTRHHFFYLFPAKESIDFSRSRYEKKKQTNKYGIPPHGAPKKTMPSFNLVHDSVKFSRTEWLVCCTVQLQRSKRGRPLFVLLRPGKKSTKHTHTHTHTHELETKRTKKVEEGGRKICRGICGGRERKKTGIHPAGMAGRRRITDLLGGRS